MNDGSATRHDFRDLLGGEERAIAAGRWPLNSTSVAYENTRVVKFGAGTLFGFTGYSSRTSSQFILAFDSNVIPAAGVVPVMVIVVPTVANFSLDFGRTGRRFDRGIVLANSSTGPTLTLGAADTWFDAQYI